MGRFLSVLCAWMVLQSCAVAYADDYSAKVWANGTASGVALQWSLPNDRPIAKEYTIMRSPSGKGRFTRIGSVKRLEEPEWQSLIIPGDIDTLKRLISFAQLNREDIRRDYSLHRLQEFSFLNPEPYLLLLGLSFSDTTCKAQSTYDYFILADGKRIGAVHAINPYKKQLPKAPSSLTLKPSANAVHLAWNIEGNFVRGIRGYNVYRYASESNAYRRINTNTVVTLNYEEDAYCYSFFEDNSVENDRTYSYYVCAVDVFGIEGEPSPIQHVMPVDIPPLSPPKIIRTVIGTRTITVQWSSVSDSRIRGYNVYRSFIGSTHKYKVNEKPLPAYSREYVDEPTDFPANFINYSITSIDNSGIESRTSFNYAAPVPDLSPPDLPDYVFTQRLGREVRLYWTKSIAKDIRGYDVSRSRGESNIMNLLNKLPVRDSMFADTLWGEELLSSQWYRVRAIDLRGNHSGWSQPLVISALMQADPVAPFVSSVTTNGRTVKILWNPPTDHALSGYYVNRYDDSSSTPLTLNINPLTKSATSFEDRTTQQGKTYWYEVVSIDTAFNYSPPSKRAVVFCGDHRHINPPSFDGIKVTGDGINISWKLQTETTPFGEVIIERSSDGEIFTPLASVPSADAFTDRSVTRNEYYSYRLRFKTLTGLVSEPSPAHIIKR
ncbi:MAG: hypothetical protein JNL32_08710 [Candidatus Kapabacteria bacterium]|nr:hypothetical protein [Candidatus Kapabacteria bacterium]